MDSATAVTWPCAVSSAWERASSQARTEHPASTAATTTTCIANSWPARLRGRSRTRRNRDRRCGMAPSLHPAVRIRAARMPRTQ
ncbi:hypothetical protein [Streptomyces sp. SCUT-3]|uniref:hypothetical protein n=1 Tax=Streptomyces sp. SCUT-3 TaxID=2684469 RepID=UPI002174DB57|nr:hypothetical protein [Streptomyces sp. SCUT-3]